MELLSYFYHPDHLGSSSASTELSNHWITDGSGNAIQHLHYLPFGEDWVDQRNSSWNTPYTFSGKEKDVETGYGYFGARYYNSGLSIWLSVDPMSDKYPSMSPYNYCANNPVMLVDPDGRKIHPPTAGGSFMIECGTTYSRLQSNSKYLSLVEGYNGDNNNNKNLYFRMEMIGSYGRTQPFYNSYVETKNGRTTTIETYSAQILMSSVNCQTEIGQAKTLLHEAVHARNFIHGTPNNQDHSGFDQAAVLTGLIEYNQSNNLGYSPEQLETISWSGCQESPEFDQYIRKKANDNHKTYEKQLEDWNTEVKAICNKPQ
jgi:RHS repeat-associated protein